ncbi:MAG: YitT family protein, partial [Pseudomonadota bacterium]
MDFGKLRRPAASLALLIAGSLLAAVAVNGILLPRGFLSGGFTGLSLLVHYLQPAWPVGALYLLLNLPLYALGWRRVGRRFFLWSIAGALILAAALQWVHPGDLGLNDRILAAILAGILVGSGTGLILRSLGSSGGTDILAVVLLKRYGLKPGSTVLGFNSAVLVGAALLISLEGALYTLVYLFVSAKITDLVVVGFSQRKAV